MSERTIDLRSYPYPILIFPYPSGIIIEQQTGGLACMQHEIEGILLPLPVYDLHLFMEALAALHPGCYGRSLSFQEACKLDHVLKRHNVPLSVSRRKPSTEAWVHVEIMGKDDHWPYRPDSNIVWQYQEFAKKIKPDITEEEVIHLCAKTILECSAFTDFAGEEAILTWENYD